jgi:hypothetical protein
MNGVMSNGISPVARSKVGSTVSPNCMTQLGHQASTFLVFDCDSLLMVLAAKRARVSVSPERSWFVPQQWVGPPITL